MVTSTQNVLRTNNTPNIVAPLYFSNGKLGPVVLKSVISIVVSALLKAGESIKVDDFLELIAEFAYPLIFYFFAPLKTKYFSDGSLV